jgi:hypothetical protein
LKSGQPLILSTQTKVAEPEEDGGEKMQFCGGPDDVGKQKR